MVEIKFGCLLARALVGIENPSLSRIVACHRHGPAAVKKLHEIRKILHRRLSGLVGIHSLVNGAAHRQAEVSCSLTAELPQSSIPCRRSGGGIVHALDHRDYDDLGLEPGLDHVFVHRENERFGVFENMLHVARMGNKIIEPLAVERIGRILWFGEGAEHFIPLARLEMRLRSDGGRRRNIIVSQHGKTAAVFQRVECALFILRRRGAAGKRKQRSQKRACD